jgi:hypothetical protein
MKIARNFGQASPHKISRAKESVKLTPPNPRVQITKISRDRVKGKK